MTHSPRASRGARSVLERAAAGARMITNALLASGLVLAVGCGLISSDVTKVTFALPPRSYRFDTQQAGWKMSAATAFAQVPSIPCGTDAECCSPLLMGTGFDCSSLICDPVSATCAFVVTVQAPPQTIDLKQTVPSSLSSQSVIDITVSEITYEVMENTLNVDLPPVQLFIADEAAASAADPTADPSAVFFGTVPVIPRMSPAGGKVTLERAATGAFINIGHHLGTPFTFLAKSRVVVPGGTPIPSGAISLTVTGKLSAQPDL